LLQELRTPAPDIALRTTFIVGFPGETREEYTELLRFLSTMEFDRAGFFRYSQEPGTPAAILEGQVSDRVKQRRWAEAMALQQEISLGRNRRWLDRDLRILVEGTGTSEDGTPLIAGRSFRDAPEIDGMIWARGTATPGSFVDVHIDRATHYDLWGSQK
jgi:ribosomal protein S12 methylthiotransferase